MISYRHNYAALHYEPRRAPRERRPIRPARAAPKVRPGRTPVPSADLLPRIDRALEMFGMGAAAFGREALGDPNLVAQLRAGRKIRHGTKARIIQCLERLDAKI